MVQHDPRMADLIRMHPRETEPVHRLKMAREQEALLLAWIQDDLWMVDDLLRISATHGDREDLHLPACGTTKVVHVILGTLVGLHLRVLPRIADTDLLQAESVRGATSQEAHLQIAWVWDSRVALLVGVLTARDPHARTPPRSSRARPLKDATKVQVTSPVAQLHFHPTSMDPVDLARSLFRSGRGCKVRKDPMDSSPIGLLRCDSTTRMPPKVTSTANLPKTGSEDLSQ